jgi:hypothetical protein
VRIIFIFLLSNKILTLQKKNMNLYLVLTFYAFASAGLSNLLNFCFQEGSIFKFYLPFLSKLIHFRHYKELKNRISEFKDSLNHYLMLKVSIKKEDFDTPFDKNGKLNEYNDKIKQYQTLIYENETKLNSSEYWIEKGSKHLLFYPLGYCLYCMSVWISFIFFTIIALTYDYSFIYLLPFSFVSFNFVLLTNK